LSIIAMVIMLVELQGLVVADEAAVVHELAQRALHHPSAFDHAEPLTCRLW
jgi:hypothetical protein